MKIISKMIKLSAPFFPLGWLCSGKNIPVLLPFYHFVSDEKNPFINNFYYPSVKQFEKQLDLLLRYFRPVSLNELYENKNHHPSFHLSFDDGLRSCFDIVAPILKKKGIPATFFVNPDFVDNRGLSHRFKESILNDFVTREKGAKTGLVSNYSDGPLLDQRARDAGLDWKTYLETEKPYMTLEQLQQLKKDGFSIGAHSNSHAEFWLLNKEQQLDEIKTSMEWVNRYFSPDIKAFAFPFSDYGVSEQVFQTVREQHICDLTFGTAGIARHLKFGHFQRLPMDNVPDINVLPRIKKLFFPCMLDSLKQKLTRNKRG